MAQSSKGDNGCRQQERRTFMWANITQIIVAIIAAVGVILSAILATGQQELKNSSAILASEQQA
jgi:hypothetical protein